MLVEAALAIMAMGEGGDLIHKSITENGNYDPADEDPPVDGYDFVSVSVETYEDELEEALAALEALQQCQERVATAVGAITGTVPQSCEDIAEALEDDIPNMIDELEQEKEEAEEEAQECNDCKAQVVSKIQQYVPNFNPQTCQDMVDAIDDVYDAGGGGGTPKYTFPAGTEYPDIFALCPSDYITDEDVGLTLKYEYDNTGRDKKLKFYAEDTGGTKESIFSETSGVRIYEWATVQVITPSTGEVQVKYGWYPSYDPSDHRTITRTYTYNFLVGFGTSGHTYSVESSGY